MDRANNQLPTKNGPKQMDRTTMDRTNMGRQQMDRTTIEPNKNGPNTKNWTEQNEPNKNGPETNGPKQNKQILRVANIIEEGKLGGPQIRIANVAHALTGKVETTVILPKDNSEKFVKMLEIFNIKHDFEETINAYEFIDAGYDYLDETRLSGDKGLQNMTLQKLNSFL